MKKVLSAILIMASVGIVSGCASMLPNSKPIATYDDFKKTWTVTSTRWGNDFTNIGRNPSIIRAFVNKDGSVTTQIYATLRTQDLMYPQYALNASEKRYAVNVIRSEVHCSSVNNCYWTQDIIISIDYQEIVDLLGTSNHFKLRVYGRQPPEDVAVLACQLWEVIKEINTIKKVDTPNAGLSCGK